MLLLSKPTPKCAECEAPAKIEALFTREAYCGRFCLAEGQLKYVRMVLRCQAEAQHVGRARSATRARRHDNLCAR